MNSADSDLVLHEEDVNIKHGLHFRGVVWVSGCMKIWWSLACVLTVSGVQC